MFFLVSTHNLITTNFKLHLLSTRIHACIYLGLTVATCDTLISRRPLETKNRSSSINHLDYTLRVTREQKKYQFHRNQSIQNSTLFLPFLSRPILTSLLRKNRNRTRLSLSKFIRHGWQEEEFVKYISISKCNGGRH